MRSTTVRITKCDEPTRWYANEIGRTFKVSNPILLRNIPGGPRVVYTLKEDLRKDVTKMRFIRSEDCEEVEEET